MFYVTGDIHGRPERLIAKIQAKHLTKLDTVIILGDAGFNYYFDMRDVVAKNKTLQVPCKIFCIQGNHEARPHNIDTYKTTTFCGGTVWYEDDFPNLLFAKDGEVYDFDGFKCLVIGGAYSVDKYYRIYSVMRSLSSIDEATLEKCKNLVFRGKNDKEAQKIMDDFVNVSRYGAGCWFRDEQISEEDKKIVLQNAITQDIDFVLSHTCPFRYIPTDMFLDGINQFSVDKSMEHWLDAIENELRGKHKQWYCGHWHTDRLVAGQKPIRFMFEDLVPLGSGFQKSVDK